MLLHMTSSMAAFTAAKGNPSGKGMESSHWEIVARAWLVSMLVYIDLHITCCKKAAIFRKLFNCSQLLEELCAVFNVGCDA